MKRITSRYTYFLAYTVLGILSAGPARAQAGAETSVSRAVERMICQNLANQAIGGDADYKPGVSASGEDVTPAEGPQAESRVREVVAVPLTIDLARRMGLDVPDDIEMKTRLGTLRIDRKGAIRFEDKDITDKAKQLCNAPDGGQQKGPELPLPGEREAGKPPEAIHTPKAPQAPDRAVSPDKPVQPSAPESPASSDAAGIDVPVHVPEMHRKGEAKPDAQESDRDDETPRAFKLSPDQIPQSQ